MRTLPKILLTMLLLTVTVTFLKLLIVLTVLAAFTVFAQGATPKLALVDIVPRMEKAQSEINTPNHVTRDYKLGRQDSAKVDSFGVAEVDFRPPGRYTVTKRSGSRGCDRAVKYILEHEIEIAMSLKDRHVPQEVAGGRRDSGELRFHVPRRNRFGLSVAS